MSESHQALALIITPDGSAIGRTIDTELRELQKIVGGYLEAVTLESCHLYCDEEGKLEGARLNVAATMLAHRLGWARGDLLCGPVVFLGNDDVGGEANVPQSVLDLFAASESGEHAGQ